MTVVPSLRRLVRRPLARPADEPLPHRRQYVLGPAPFDRVRGWRHEQIGGVWLSHCPTLPVSLGEGAGGTRWALLGRAVESSGESTMPAEQLAAAEVASLPGLYSGWAGRWALVAGESLHLDALGLLGAYFGRDGKGALWTSSSPALAARATAGDGPLPAPEPWPLHYQGGMSWVTLPRSRYPGVRHLLPSQVLGLSDGSLRARPLVDALDAGRPYEETLSALADALTAALAQLPRSAPLSLGLTAGADSRVVLVAALRTLRPRAYTRLAPRLSVADRLLPPRLASAAGVEHDFVRGRLRRRRRALLLEHTGGHVAPGDAEPFLRGARGRLEGFSAGGWAFELGRASRRLPSRLTDPAADAARIARARSVPAWSPANEALREWLEWVAATDDGTLDLRDRMSIEQANAGWQAAKEQLYDLEPVERFFALNARRTVGLLLSLPEEARVSRRWQHDLVRRHAPALAAFPYNPPARSFGLASAARVRARHPVEPLARAARRARRKAVGRGARVA